MAPMNPDSAFLARHHRHRRVAALVAGLAIGLALARSRTRAAVDAALAQAGHAAQLELAQARERLRAQRAGDGGAAGRAGARPRRDAQAARDEVLRVSASEAQKHQHVASLAERVADLEARSREPPRQLERPQRRAADRRTPSSRTRARARTRNARARRKSCSCSPRPKTALSDQFKTLANEILEEKSKRFAEQNQQNLGTLLDPLRTQLSEFKGKVEEVYVKEGQERFALTEQVKQLMELNKTLSRDANNLTKALKGSAKTQGNWGELILERVLEASGLREGPRSTTCR